LISLSPPGERARVRGIKSNALLPLTLILSPRGRGEYFHPSWRPKRHEGLDSKMNQVKKQNRNLVLKTHKTCPK